MDAFSILFTNEMLENIVQNTNEWITNILEKFVYLLKQSDRHAQIKEATIDRMKAFIGLLCCN